MRLLKSLFFLALVAFSYNTIAESDLELRLPIGATPAVYTFDASPWSTCSVFTSTQQRTGSCLLNGTTTVADGFCSAFNTDRDQSCAPSYTYAYSYSNYGTCSLTTATQQRTAVCLRDHDSAISDNSLCSGTPSLSRSCTPNYTYAYTYGSYGTCSLTTATQQRSATCKRVHDGLVSNNTLCGTPSLSRSCTPNYTYSVTYGSYGACSTSTSKQTRSATCRRVHDGKVSSTSLCGSVSLTRACTPTTYAWSVGGYGACTGRWRICLDETEGVCLIEGFKAGTGTQSRSVLCKASPGNATVSSSLCTAGRPSSSRSC